MKIVEKYIIKNTNVCASESIEKLIEFGHRLGLINMEIEKIKTRVGGG